MHAWEFQTLNNIAEKHGWHKFISMQDYHSLLQREEEHEMFPYCRDAGIGIIPWSPLARGWLARPYDVSKSQPTDRQTTDHYTELLIGPITKEDAEIIRRVEELAKKNKVAMAQISIAWSLKKGTNPILGLSSIKRVDEAASVITQMKDGLLTEEDLQYLEAPYVPKAPASGAW
jgi:aryl-alcohol dehydrogenase-like predicted oxidoreductase